MDFRFVEASLHQRQLIKAIHTVRLTLLDWIDLIVSMSLSSIRSIRIFNWHTVTAQRTLRRSALSYDSCHEWRASAWELVVACCVLITSFLTNNFQFLFFSFFWSCLSYDFVLRRNTYGNGKLEIGTHISIGFGLFFASLLQTLPIPSTIQRSHIGNLGRHNSLSFSTISLPEHLCPDHLFVKKIIDIRAWQSWPVQYGKDFTGPVSGVSDLFEKFIG